MQLTSRSDYSDFYVEAALEEQRLAMLYGTNPTDAARKHGIDEYIEVTPKKGKDKGKTVKIRIQDILKARPKFFLAEFEIENPDLIHYNQIVDNLAEKFAKWLLEKHTERYQAIDTPEQVEWLHLIANMAVSDYIQECKYRGYALHNRRTFANQDVATTITRLKIASSMTKITAESVNSNIKKYKKQAEDGELDSEVMEKIQEQRDDFIDGVETKLKNVLSDSPPPFIEQYRKEQKKLKQDNSQPLLDDQAVNE